MTNRSADKFPRRQTRTNKQIAKWIKDAASPLIGKCVFLESSVKFLGHIIENGRIFPSKRKIKIIHEFLDRSTARQTQSFLDLTSKGTSTNVQNYLSFGYIHSASEIIGRFKRHATVFGNSRRIVSDRGTAFTSRDFEEYCKGETIEHIRIATGTPRGYGQVRRVNRTLISLLTKLAHPKKVKWHRLQYLNVTQHRSNVPFKIFFGINARLYENLEVRDFSEKERVADFQSDR
ncbi:hypothetical protein HZH66_014710 [Vespula vulgaris]|uniref:Integrase catalytic domain-containing protein n=1 Tax=Vespula vulgaris TaxID=7454 RepID=A0A834MPV4_VESVU|nr:hypothetical protein HZH66_014710 [Vespula vulgaris]